MYKYLFLIILIVFLFGAGFFVGRKSISIQYIRPAEVSEAITNIINYTNYIRTLEYVTNDTTGVQTYNIPYEELVIMYNDLLKRSKEVSLSYDVLFENYEKLEKIANRRLYFLVGIRRWKLRRDVGENLGLEHSYETGKVRKWQGRMRELIDNNDSLKRLYSREAVK